MALHLIKGMDLFVFTFAMNNFLLNKAEFKILDGMRVSPLHFVVWREYGRMNPSHFKTRLETKADMKLYMYHVVHLDPPPPKERKNNRNKTPINNTRGYRIKHEKSYRVLLTLMDETSNLRWCLHVGQAENMWCRGRSCEVDSWLIERIKTRL